MCSKRDMQDAIDLLRRVNHYETRMTMGDDWVRRVDDLLERHGDLENQDDNQE